MTWRGHVTNRAAPAYVFANGIYNGPMTERLVQPIKRPRRTCVYAVWAVPLALQQLQPLPTVRLPHV